MSRIIIIEFLSYEIHQIIPNIIPYMSIALICGCCNPNVPINVKIYKKYEPDLFSFHGVKYIFMILLCDLYRMIEHLISIIVVPYELHFDTLWAQLGKL